MPMINAAKALIIQPGAVGDVILTLPLLQFILAERAIDRVDMMGHLQRIEYLQPRTQLSEAISMESVALHRLFEKSDDFQWDDCPDLIEFFRPYELIVTFLSDKEGHFEKNLVAATTRTSACDVATLKLRPDPDCATHVSTFFIHQFIREMPDMELNARRSYLDWPKIEAAETCQEKGASLLKKHNVDLDRPLVLIHPGSGGKKKCWPIEYFVQLAEEIKERGQTPLFLLGPVEKEKTPELMALLAKDHPVISDSNLDQLATLLTCAAAYIGNDSGITHLAAAICPTLAIFGPTDPVYWQPLGKQVTLCRSKSINSAFWPEPDQVFSALREIF
jgi:heptosyltransferase-3